MLTFLFFPTVSVVKNVSSVFLFPEQATFLSWFLLVLPESLLQWCFLKNQTGISEICNVPNTYWWSYQIRIWPQDITRIFNKGFSNESFRNSFRRFSKKYCLNFRRYKCVHQYQKNKELYKCLFLKPAEGMA